VRSAPPATRAGSDRWLISYADLMTLLFAFSMTLYAAHAEHPDRVSFVGQGRATAARQTKVVPTTPAIAPVSAVSRDAALEQRLARELAGAIGARRLELIRDTRGLVVSMPDDAAFPTGSAEATGEARRLIERVGDTLREVPNGIRIEGHTDNVPIRTARDESNWELSTARASAIVAVLVDRVGIDAGRLSAAGYGQYHPLNPNDTEAHRARNRRVDLVILDLPSAAAPVQPAPGDPSAAP
jgi:chemotaxis protein MotB